MKTIPLTQGKVAVIDDEDYELVTQYKWHALKNHNTWYAYTNTENGYIGMHRLILGTPKGYETDHRDRNGLNNRRKNLRIATRAQNMQNRPLRSDNKSGFRGVHWYARASRWRVRIKHQGKAIECGNYKDLIEAARAYDAKARELFGEFASLNFPEGVGTEPNGQGKRLLTALAPQESASQQPGGMER